MIPEAKAYAEVFVCSKGEIAVIVLDRLDAAMRINAGYSVYQLHNALKVESFDILINDELKRMVKGTSESNG
jgi:hypothetical protein